eukprot:2691276-Prymnesium_polylepis.1
MFGHPFARGLVTRNHNTAPRRHRRRSAHLAEPGWAPARRAPLPDPSVCPHQPVTTRDCGVRGRRQGGPGESTLQ